MGPRVKSIGPSHRYDAICNSRPTSGTSVLFMYPEHVSQIRIVVENGWNFNEAGDAGRALMRKMKSDIRGRPMQNQTSGRRVGRIQQFLGRYMTRLDEEVVSIKHQRKGEQLMSNLHVADAYI